LSALIRLSRASIADCRERSGKASARPELENDPKRTRTVQDFLQRKFIIEAHFAGRKSLL